jgi:hypothetical protein
VSVKACPAVGSINHCVSALFPRPGDLNHYPAHVRTTGSEAFHILIATLSDWKQHRCEPDQTAQSYLKVIAHYPNAVRKALKPAT